MSAPVDTPDGPRTVIVASTLGLAIVAELVAAHDGTVAMTTTTLGGTRVEVTLPALA